MDPTKCSNPTRVARLEETKGLNMSVETEVKIRRKLEEAETRLFQVQSDLVRRKDWKAAEVNRLKGVIAALKWVLRDSRKAW